MNWISLDDRLPELNADIYLCKEGDINQWIDEGFLVKNHLPEERCSDDFVFDGPGWFVPLPVSNFTHWMPKQLPIHIDLTSSSSGE